MTKKVLTYTIFLFLSLIFLTFVFINATPGHFVYEDPDGCACSVSYTKKII